MYPILVHIYGPFNINSFSIALAFAIAIFLFLARRRASSLGIMSQEDFTNGFIECALAGIIGGRIFHILSAWQHYTTILDMFKIWNGGLSVLGSIIGVGIYASIYARLKSIPLLPAFDCVALYASLAHGVARIGCFLAGCCYGKPTTLPWGITYTNPEVVAPLHTALHPTQLYSAFSLIAIFFFIRFIGEKWCTKTGEITMLYLMFTSFERWFIDFLRGDRIIDSSTSVITTHWFSWNQWLALGIFTISLTCFIYSKLRSRQRHYIHESF